jgi:membrane protease YdiL (CAAX protease family)
MRWFGAPQSAMPGVGAFALYRIVLPLAILIGGPLGEELGFRGYALPLLLPRHPGLVAVVILCALHGGFNAAQQQFTGGFSGPDSTNAQLLTAVG